MDIKQTKNEKNVATVEVTVTKQEVDEQKDHAVTELASQVTVKGFRQGKAPKNLAEQHLNPEKVTDHVINHLLSSAVTKTLSEYKYHLFGRPVLNDLDAKGENWKIVLNFPLYPTFELGDYKNTIKSSIKTATKKKKESDKTQNKEDRLDHIYTTLLKNTPIDIPSSVIDEEVNYSLQRLAAQAQSLHLTLDKYLSAINRTPDQVKEEYKQKAADSLKLDLILIEIAKKEKIEATQEEITSLAKSANLSDNQDNRLRSIIVRRKVLDLLASF